MLHRRVNKTDAYERTVEALKQVGIGNAEQRFHEYSHQLSGGLRQRCMIAMALSCNPRLLIADESTTALDVTIQAQILELLKKLQAGYGMAILMITHNLGVIAEMANRVAVMYMGKVVEMADARTLFSPRMTVLEVVAEPLEIHGITDGDEFKARVRELLEMVGLRVQHMNRFPHAFSGGQRQRIGVARALALEPKLIVADEPVSALDVSIQAQVLNLLKDLETRLGLAYLFVSHDLSVVEHISDRVAVMYLGGIVEVAPAQRLYAAPKHPYTEALLSAIPKTDPDQQSRRIILQGDVPNPANPPTGCTFHPRCRFAQEICKVDKPPLIEVEPGHQAACHFATELQLAGIEH